MTINAHPNSPSSKSYEARVELQNGRLRALSERVNSFLLHQ